MVETELSKVILLIQITHKSVREGYQVLDAKAPIRKVINYSNERAIF